MKLLKKLRDQNGQTMVEYALIAIALIAIVLIAFNGTLQQAIVGAFQNLAGQLNP